MKHKSNMIHLIKERNDIYFTFCYVVVEINPLFNRKVSKKKKKKKTFNKDHFELI